jgi:hypothetical protein
LYRKTNSMRLSLNEKEPKKRIYYFICYVFLLPYIMKTICQGGFYFFYPYFHEYHLFGKVTWYKTTFRHSIFTKILVFFGMEMSLLRQIFGICTTQLSGDDDC